MAFGCNRTLRAFGIELRCSEGTWRFMAGYKWGYKAFGFLLRVL